MVTGSIKAFIRAVMLGAMAGGGPFLVLMMLIALNGIGRDGFGEILFGATLPILIAGATVLAAMMLFGLPLTAWLAREQREEVHTYAAFGIGLGIAIPIVVFTTLDSVGTALFLAVPGAFAGFVTARSWGRWREKIRDFAAAEFE